MPTFKVDENLPAEAAEVLVSAGHDAVTVGDQRMSGQPDTNVATVCQHEGRAIVTLDLDFADLRTCPPCDANLLSSLLSPFYSLAAGASLSSPHSFLAAHRAAPVSVPRKLTHLVSPPRLTVVVRPH